MCGVLCCVHKKKISTVGAIQNCNDVKFVFDSTIAKLKHIKAYLIKEHRGSSAKVKSLAANPPHTNDRGGFQKKKMGS
jgi:hypothetical protein